MESLAYTHSAIASEDVAAGLEYNLPTLQLPSSAWLGFLGVAVLFGSINPASAAQYYVKTSGSCLNARTGPGPGYGVVKCVRNGAALAPVVSYKNGYAKLSTGRYVAAAYISTTPGTGTGSGPGVGGSYLSRGSTGTAVKQVQAKLGVSQTGYFGSQTQAAVKNFQAKNGLLADGIVGPQTRSALGL